MSDNILVDASLRLISSALEEYTDWHTLVLRHIFFSEYAGELPYPEYPRAIRALQEILKNQPDLNLGDIDRVFKSSEILQKIVDEFFNLPEGSRLFTHAQFSDFALLYDDMIHRLHRIEHARYLAGFGYDGVTGLRNESVLFQDLACEMERMARRGRSFTLVLARVDFAEALRAQLEGKYADLQRHIGTAILSTIRTFDDAYHLYGDEFVMTLKHSDPQGAQRFVARLRDRLSEGAFSLDNKEVSFTLSFCVAEPVDGEDMPQFLEMMRSDLGARAETTPDAIVYHEEESPIRRFLREKKGA